MTAPTTSHHHGLWLFLEMVILFVLASAMILYSCECEDTFWTISITHDDYIESTNPQSTKQVGEGSSLTITYQPANNCRTLGYYIDGVYTEALNSRSMTLNAIDHNVLVKIIGEPIGG